MNNVRKRLDHNLRFMIGGVILFFAIILVVVLFSALSLKVYWDKNGSPETTSYYTFTLTDGFKGKSYSVFVNDSMLYNGVVDVDSLTLYANRMAQQDALLVVDNATDNLTIIDLEGRGHLMVCRRNGVVEWKMKE